MLDTFYREVTTARVKVYLNAVLKETEMVLIVILLRYIF